MTIDEQLREIARHANQRQAITAEEIVQRASRQPTGSLTARFRFIDRRHVVNHRPVQVSNEEPTLLDVETPTPTDERRNGPNRVVMLGVLAAAAAVIAIAVLAIREDDSVDQRSATATASEAHPIVGTWTITHTIGPWVSKFNGTFWADGNYEQVDPEGTHLGVWESTGPTTAALTFLVPQPSNETVECRGLCAGAETIRATIEVAPDGQSFTGEYTVEGGPRGTGEQGPREFTGTRVVVEPMGTPVGPIMGPVFGTLPPPSPFEGNMAPATTEMAAPTTG